MMTQLLDLTVAEEYEDKLCRAAQVIRDGGLVVFPTETVYGLGADGTSATAAEKIYRAKGRPSDNPLILHVAEPADAERYAYTTDPYYRLAEAFMPGPLTVVLRAKDTVPMATRGGLDTVAIRCPSHPIAHDLIRMAGVAIAAPSANLSGSPSPTVARHVADDMNGRVDMILNGGDCDFGLESTIVRIDNDGGLTLLRPGRITPEDLALVCGEVRIADAVLAALRDGEIAQSPGMKYRHYAPASPVVLLDGDTEACIAYLKRQNDERMAFICYTEDAARYREVFADACIFDFGSREDEGAQAHRLFYILREADKQNFSCIYAPTPRKEGIGLALYNRMIRASAYRIVALTSGGEIRSDNK